MRTLILFLSLGLVLCPAVIAETNRLVVHADQGKTQINRNIYGHFAEHLGRCIYEGGWVGEDSPIPNMRGIRNDVGAAPYICGNVGSGTVQEMQELVTKHSAIMDKSRPSCRRNFEPLFLINLARSHLSLSRCVLLDCLRCLSNNSL